MFNRKNLSRFYDLDNRRETDGSNSLPLNLTKQVLILADRNRINYGGVSYIEKDMVRRN